MALHRRIAGVVLGVVGLIAACSSGSSSGPPSSTADGGASGAHDPLTLDEIATELADGVDDPVPVSEEQLDAVFPVEERMTEIDDPDDRDPTKGSDANLQAAFDAFMTTENADDHFTVDEIAAGATPGVVEHVKKGVLWGMANWDAFMPGFSVMSATNTKAGGKRFFVSIRTTPNAQGDYRTSVTMCGGAKPAPVTIADVVKAIEDDTCVPRLVFRVQVADVGSIAPRLFLHEVSHVAQGYWEQSPAYLDAGGLKLATAYHKGFSYQVEGDAKFNERHAPWTGSYAGYANKGCPFEPLRRGVVAWKGFASKGAESYLPYEMSSLVEQITWRRFAKDPTWIYQWLIATVDPRTVANPPKAPINAARRLLRVISKDPNKVDLSSLSRVMLDTGVDLYGYGRVPWTTSVLGSECVRSTASVDLPAFAFDAVSVDPGDLSKVGRLRLALEASRDQAFVRAGVAAVDVKADGTFDFVDCAKAIPDAKLNDAEPRLACAANVHWLGALTRKNEWKDDVKLPPTLALGKHRIVAIVFHLLPRSDATWAPITVTLRAEPTSTPPRNTITKDDCPGITDDYRSHCKTSNCFCIGNAYCESVVEAAPGCEVFERDCGFWCVMQKSECDCTSFCDVMKARLGC